jgi:hypothetical protein
MEGLGVTAGFQYAQHFSQALRTMEGVTISSLDVYGLLDALLAALEPSPARDIVVELVSNSEAFYERSEEAIDRIAALGVALPSLPSRYLGRGPLPNLGGRMRCPLCSGEGSGMNAGHGYVLEGLINHIAGKGGSRSTPCLVWVGLKLLAKLQNEPKRLQKLAEQERLDKLAALARVRQAAAERDAKMRPIWDARNAKLRSAALERSARKRADKARKPE